MIDVFPSWGRKWDDVVVELNMASSSSWDVTYGSPMRRLYSAGLVLVTFLLSRYSLCLLLLISYIILFLFSCMVTTDKTADVNILIFSLSNICNECCELTVILCYLFFWTIDVFLFSLLVTSGSVNIFI